MLDHRGVYALLLRQRTTTFIWWIFSRNVLSNYLIFDIVNLMATTNFIICIDLNLFRSSPGYRCWNLFCHLMHMTDCSWMDGMELNGIDNLNSLHILYVLQKIRIFLMLFNWNLQMMDSKKIIIWQY